jgi:muramoyltetrapeptide carboxypeptidase
MSNLTPPYLSPGDTIGICCPAGYMDADRIVACVQTLKSWGFQVKIGQTIGGHSDNYFSGTDEERLQDLQKMLDDDDIRAILFGRGGYGLSRIMDQINFKRFCRSPKWLLGYSDISLLHYHVFANYEIATAHSPMAGAFQDSPPADPYILSMLDLLTGKPARYYCEPHSLNRMGEAHGLLAGGNLTLLAHAVGGSSEIKTKNNILFIEDIGEYIYNVDRMLYQLKAAGKFRKPAAVIVGHFTDLKDTERPFGKNAYQIIREILNEYEYPLCFGFPTGHVKENLALKCGAEFNLKVNRAGVELVEV